MKKRPFKSLSEEIYLIQLEDNQNSNKLNSIDEETKKRIMLFSIPLITGATISLNTQSIFYAIAGTFVVFAGALIITAKEDLIDEKRKRRSNIIYLPTAKTSNIFHQPDEYYTSMASDLLKSKTSTESSLEFILDKDKAIEQLNYEVDLYRLIYNLPTINISDEEWNILLDSIYEELLNSSQENNFYDFTSSLIRYTFAYSLIKDNKCITIETFLTALKRVNDKKKHIISYEKIEDNLSSYISDKIIDFKTLKLERRVLNGFHQ